MRRVLELAGFRVLVATNGREALEIFRAQGDCIAAVLLDWTMPHLGGAETFEELRRLCPEVRVILCSGFSEEEVTRRVSGDGLNGFVQKPFQIPANGAGPQS
jgi:two-component system cell cycle sensor histidine kinase/response regulator CckA